MKHTAREKRRIKQAFEKFWEANSQSVTEPRFDMKRFVRFSFSSGYNTAMNDLLKRTDTE